jgi:hypothetical protein
LEINDNLSKQIEYLYDLSKEVKKGYEKLKYDFENNQYAIHNFDQLHALIEDIDAPNNVFEMILDMFIGELQNIHHARLAAINRYEGEYWAFNFYHEISLVVEKLFDDFFLYSKEKIVEKVNEFMNYRNIVELDRINYRVFLEKFERDYNEYRSQLKEYIKDKIKSNFRKITWDQAVEHYGHGRGYTDRVLDIYANELKLFASKINVPDNYNERWDKIIYENSL